MQLVMALPVQRCGTFRYARGGAPLAKETRGESFRIFVLARYRLTLIDLPLRLCRRRRVVYVEQLPISRIALL